MNIERFQERVLRTMVLLGGLLFAVFCGMQAGGGNFQKLAVIFTVLTILAICMMMRERLWTLIPLCWGLSGKLVAFPVPVALRDLIVIVVFVAFFAFRALKVIRTRVSFTFLELLVLSNVLYAVIMFVRNPVGAKAFGSDMVGGRPYWDIAISALACWVLATAPADRKNLLRVPFFILVGAGIHCGAELLGYVAPSVAMFFAEFYSGFASMSGDVTTMAAIDPAFVRWVPLGELGVLGVVALCAYFRPLTLFFAPLRLIALGLSMVGILLSGHRAAVLKAGAAMFFSTLLRRRMRDMVTLGVTGFFLLIIVIIGNGRLFNLPLVAQRALSFLPGKWDQEATQDAKASAQWRIDMWEMVITEDKWIQNKWLGDGFGFTKRELSIMETMSIGGPGFLGGAQQELFMIVGSFHNGPLSAIRYGGAVGLVLLLTLMILSLRRALDLIKRSFDTPYFPIALFIGIPLMYAPIEFTFIFGGYDGSLPLAILMGGYLSLLRRNILETPFIHGQEAQLLEPSTENRSVQLAPLGRSGRVG